MSAAPTTAGAGAPLPVADLPRESAPPGTRANLLGELLYVALGVPLSAVYFTLVAGGFLFGVLLGTFWVGLPLLLAASSLIWRCAAFERTIANRLLDARIAPLPPLPEARGPGLRRRVVRRMTSRAFWRAVLLLALRLPVTVGAFTAITAIGGTAVALVISGVHGLESEGGYVGPFSLGPALGIAAMLLAVPVGVIAVALTRWLGGLQRWLARSLLATTLERGAPVRDALAQSIGDRSLAIAYWLPDKAAFVDEQGRPVELPKHGSDRAWTPVDHQGRRVAALIHDASLQASPELIQAAAAAASLALDNEQLKADLRARVEELRASRIRIVEASNSARRRLERDLHDGAQQQLVALAVELKLLRSRVGSQPDATGLIDRIEDKLSAALDELRELARGIHPGILTDRGLAPALESLAGRAPLPVGCEIDLPQRPPASVEAVAYFVVAEALTNVLKYANSSHAAVRARYDGGDLVVEMEDDGVGGADESKGTGLQGLRDRVGALDGTLSIVSTVGTGTLVQARIPAGPPPPPPAPGTGAPAG